MSVQQKNGALTMAIHSLNIKFAQTLEMGAATLSETIISILGHYPEALNIAWECLHHSKCFGMELTEMDTLWSCHERCLENESSLYAP